MNYMDYIDRGSKIKSCPKCGGTIIVSRLYMYSLNSCIGKRGKLLKKAKYCDDGPIDTMLASCENYYMKCDVHWNADEFIIDDESCFIDYKYSDRSDDI